ncbi:sirohydrochlorin cobaltochelatase [Pseudodesulfovibrio sp.]|uniref:sirohydrochlorin cobaltochelatase n=1 Tax=Pseudodesulfovibrio sp. TaxID=2035812 RepID=UPI00262D81D8|nr:sirohydrochlorin cobaltochelatase [Pseudodesulfovibrio sp.]MDD3313369.1 sirohydrochlorin cobaltochelatase [Pseudodesulfovibrio sp.]
MSFSRLMAALPALAVALVLTLTVPAMAGHGESGPARQAVVLTAFGTSYPEALKSILNIQSRIEKACPGVPVRLAFTSAIIRQIWRERQDDKAWQQDNPGVPADILFVKSPLATIADLQNEGYKDVTVQSLHVFAGEEFTDVQSLVKSLSSISTLKARNAVFTRISLGRPALGMPGDAHPYTEDIAAGAKALKADVDQARKMKAALVYMGHGNDFFSTGIYMEMQHELQAAYGYPVFIGCVEGFPSLEAIIPAIKASGKKAILLKPFMVVAGDHANNDMAGDEEDSWKSVLTKAGFKVTPELRGLGSVDAWADIYVDHLKSALAN